MRKFKHVKSNIYLSLSRPESIFKMKEILMGNHMCTPYGRKLSPTKVDVIQTMCENPFEVWVFFGVKSLLTAFAHKTTFTFNSLASSIEAPSTNHVGMKQSLQIRHASQKKRLRFQLCLVLQETNQGMPDIFPNTK